ncbi:hypothetical protein MHF_1560 [Mycoplasma haemofelis Ohio2]|uniref:Uncharacterized protein n=1 Tax=Mycoplasma haemofelis (strain Ohio2) TaxID=859194 RepID=F6FHG2_MYCHI|nr:hypothetical protein MHF_1560 [Mycoplasma haemofelis Ohio2]
MSDLKSHFLILSQRIYLSPSDKVLDDCLRYLEEADSDLNKLKSFDTLGVSPFSSKEEIGIDSSLFTESTEANENVELLQDLIHNYEFVNIQIKKADSGGD